MDAFDRSQWPRTDLEIFMVRSCLFTAQATARDMMEAGRQKEIEEIGKLIDTVAPPLPENLIAASLSTDPPALRSVLP